MSFKNVFAPAPHIARRSEEEVKRLYPRFRWQILEATFIGYAAFYLVRNNLSVVAKDIEGALGYAHSDMGTLLAVTAICYGLGKFLMGSFSDRSNPRIFMACGLLATACCNFAFGSVSSFPLHMMLWAVNGFVQGMGWPP
ncbi:MAG: MFS transporter, partial [Candidatus Hydrogenedentes bacterium]|nr:MFS transporter [Candidatus Hydrogenedentota bacterium]